MLNDAFLLDEQERQRKVACPKCGSETGWTGPKYVRFDHYSYHRSYEWLIFVCATCGFERREHTKDYVEPPATPPPPPPNQMIKGWPWNWWKARESHASDQ